MVLMRRKGCVYEALLINVILWSMFNFGVYAVKMVSISQVQPRKAFPSRGTDWGSVNRGYQTCSDKRYSNDRVPLVTAVVDASPVRIKEPYLLINLS